MPCAGNVTTVVAAQTFVQSSGGDLGTTSLFTPSASGLFRMTVNLESASEIWSEGGSNAVVQPTWTDDYGNTGSNFSEVVAAKALSYQWIFRSAASEPIEIGTSGIATTSAYTLTAVVEQLA